MHSSSFRVMTEVRVCAKSGRASKGWRRGDIDKLKMRKTSRSMQRSGKVRNRGGLTRISARESSGMSVSMAP